MPDMCLRTLLAFIVLTMSGSIALAKSSVIDDCIAATDSGRYQQAVDICTDALESSDLDDTDQANAHFKRGLALKNLERYQEAIDDYSEAIEIIPDWFEAWVNRGNAYTWLGAYERGIEDYDHALELRPNEYITLENRAQAYADLRQYDRALEDYDASLKQNPEYEAAYMDRAVTYETLGDLDRALQDLNKAIELKPDYMLAYGNRSSVLRKLRRYDEALRDLEMVEQLDPNDARRFYGLGQTYFEMGQFESATAAFEQAIEAEPANPYMAIWYFLSVARQGNSLSAARSRSRELLGHWDITMWPSPITQFFLGYVDSASVLAAAENENETCEALFYVGMIDLLENDVASGRARLEQASTDCPTDFIEPYAARAELARLDQQ